MKSFFKRERKDKDERRTKGKAFKRKRGYSQYPTSVYKLQINIDFIGNI